MPEERQQRILAVNSGSSSLKVSLFAIAETEEILVSIEVQRIGISKGRIRASNAKGDTLLDRNAEFPNHRVALVETLRWLREQHQQIDAVGHRVVHGGHYTEHQIITPQLISVLRELTPIDPDHLPQAISAIETVTREHPSLPQVACFDTAFHRQMPQVAQLCPLPMRFYEAGILRYGFHGLSYEYVASELQRLDGHLADQRVVIAHLGNGASMVALHHGKSMDTTMGFTPTAGLLMGTRSGDIDPGVLLYLIEERKMTARAVNDLLNRQSGLLGISGASEDMRDLLEREKRDPHAALAIQLFCLRVKKYLGAYAALLGGLDALVFTAGIGEHAPEVRERICSELDFLGIRLDPARNRENADAISAKSSRVKVRVIKTKEELMIARHTAKLTATQRD